MIIPDDARINEPCTSQSIKYQLNASSRNNSVSSSCETSTSADVYFEGCLSQRSESFVSNEARGGKQKKSCSRIHSRTFVRNNTVEPSGKSNSPRDSRLLTIYTEKRYLHLAGISLFSV